jgi:hypothetical protein
MAYNGINFNRARTSPRQVTVAGGTMRPEVIGDPAMRQAVMQQAQPQSVAEILSEPLGEMGPDLTGAQGTASRQREIADLLTNRAMGRNATGLVDGFAQLGEAFLANKAGKRADKAEADAQGVQSLLIQQAMQGGDQGQQSIAQLLGASGDPMAAINYKTQMDATAKADERYTDETQYGRGRDAMSDQRYADETQYGRGRDALSDTRYTQEYTDQRGDVAYERSAASAARRSSAERPVALGDGGALVYNPQTKAWEMQTLGGGGASPGGAGATGTPAGDNFYIPTSADAENPFIQLQFGGSPTQGTNGGTLFDNGEIYTPGASDAQQGGGVPPGMDPGLYQRYRGSEYAKTDAKIAKDAREAAIKISTKTMPQIAQLKSLSTQFPSGFTSDLQYEAGRAVPFLRGNVGMNESQMAARDTFVSQTKAFVLDLAQQMKGSLSDSDRAWVETMGARTNMTPESINQVLDTAERMAERQEFYAQGAEVWSNQYGGLSMTDQTGKNFYQAWSDWSSMNPITGGTYGGDAPTSGAPAGGRGGVRSGAAGGRTAAPAKINDDAGYDALPSGAEFIGPDGVRRRKP